MNVIFCIPYAGGAASAYGELKMMAEKRNLRLVPLELAGHASRLTEVPYKDFAEAVDDCYKMITDYLHRNYVESYAIFGHSMGSWITYELVEKLKQDPTVDNPAKLFLSANTIPQIEIDHKTEQYTDDEFWNWSYQLGGMEKELYEMPEFKSYILPIIRNDYRILENYAGKNVPVRDLAMDLYMMGGRQDDISQEEFEEWQRFTSQNMEMEWFEGNHFYFKDEPKRVVDYFCQKMQTES